jgi:hypothetical protein
MAMAIPVLVLVVATGVYPLLTLLIHCGLFGAMSLVYGYRSTKNARFDTGTVVVTHRGLELDGRLVAEKDDLKQGFLVPTPSNMLVRLERKSFSPSIDVRVKDEAEGHELLRALGFDAEQTAAEMRIATGLAALPVMQQVLMIVPAMLGMVLGGAVAAIVLRQAGGPIAFAMVALAILYTFTIAFTPTRVRIGTDGIATRWFGRERFIPFDAISKIETYNEIIGTKRHRGVKVWIAKTGEMVRLPTGQTDIGETEAARLIERIEEARKARQAGATARIEDLLVRGERDAKSWLEALRRIGSGVHGLRTSAVPTDALLRVVEDARAAPAARASAAVAAASEPTARARIRLAAETTASPKLRVAFERIADEQTPDTDLERSLDDFG